MSKIGKRFKTITFFFKPDIKAWLLGKTSTVSHLRGSDLMRMPEQSERHYRARIL
jgi:hypothetical protein